MRAFLLDQTEVTVAAYQAYCTAKGNCAQVGTASGCNFGVPGREQHPINCVTWDQAVAYCDSLGKRLPTEIEWEYAARGPLSPEYPWGATAPTTDLCWNRTSTCEVGQFSSTLLGAVVADGLYDMGGNVYEWTSSHLCPYPITDPNCDPGAAACTWPDAQTGMVMYMGPCRINRGGSYRVTNAKYVHAGYRDPDPVAHQSPGVGFRCAQ